MMKKNKSAFKGPSLIEVVLAAVLSLLLGVAVAILYLVERPVLKVAQIPKDAPAGAVYYIEGSRDLIKTSVVQDKRKLFVAGKSISLQDSELNVLLEEDVPPAPPAKAGAAPEPKTIDAGALNARIRDGKIQFADTVTFNIYGVITSVVVQARGVFEKDGQEFVFRPDVLYVGGCPMQHVPYLKDLALRKLLFTEPIPPDVAASWARLVDVAIDGSTLKLRMP